MADGQIINQNIDFPYRGPSALAAQYLLIDAASADDVGIWVPFAPFRNGSFEVTSVGDLSAIVVLKCSNAALMPANGFTITIASSEITPGDIITAAIFNADLLNGNATASYTVVESDTNNTIAAGLAAALVAVLALQASQTVNDEYVNAAAGYIQVTNVADTAVIKVFWQAVLQPTGLETSLSSDATESATVAQYDDGSGFVVPNCSLTEVGNVVFDQPCAWIKATVSSYSTGAITAIVQASSP